MLILVSILAMLLLFNLSIFMHELGHFLAARSLGLAADVFSVGMGPALWKRKFGATVWKLGALPFGGYVALPQMDPNTFLQSGAKPGRDAAPPASGGSFDNSPSATGEPRNLPPVAPWKKIIVSVAGAFGNIVFAFVLATIVWWVGKPASLQEQNAVVGYVATNSPAWTAGLAAGDEILAVDGQPVGTWIEVAEKAALAPADTVVLHVRTPEDEERDLTLAMEKTSIGIRLLAGIDGMDSCQVAAITPGSGAEAAGLLPGDRITGFDGQPVYSRAHLSQRVESGAGRPAEIEFRRGEEILTAPVESAYNEKLNRHLIGIQFNTLGNLDVETRSHPPPWAQVRSHAGAIFRFLGALSTPATSGAAADAVGGPILILIMLWLMLESSFILAIWFTGLINVNLAIINLLPIPVLDGGHVVMSVYEWIFRRPPPARLVNALYNLFAVLILGLFLLLVFRDSVRHIVPGVQHWFRKPPPAAAPEAGAGEPAETP